MTWMRKQVWRYSYKKQLIRWKKWYRWRSKSLSIRWKKWYRWISKSLSGRWKKWYRWRSKSLCSSKKNLTYKKSLNCRLQMVSGYPALYPPCRPSSAKPYLAICRQKCCAQLRLCSCWKSSSLTKKASGPWSNRRRGRTSHGWKLPL